ncbi:MAG: hypothetical protein WCW02_01625 [Candidatus Buchananbacteria bacterium]
MKNLLKSIGNFIVAIIQLLLDGTQHITEQVVAKVKPFATAYICILAFLAFVSAVLPLVIFGVALGLKLHWLIAIAGIVLAILHLAAGYLATPLVVILGASLVALKSPIKVVMGTIRGDQDGIICQMEKIAKWWVNSFMMVVFWEMCVVLYTFIFPVWQNAASFIGLIFVALLSAIMVQAFSIKSTLVPKLVRWLVVPATFLFLTLSFILPQTTTALGDKIPTLDKNWSEVVKNGPKVQDAIPQPVAPQVLPPVVNQSTTVEDQEKHLTKGEVWEFRIDPLARHYEIRPEMDVELSYNPASFPPGTKVDYLIGPSRPYVTTPKAVQNIMGKITAQADGKVIIFQSR